MRKQTLGHLQKPAVQLDSAPNTLTTRFWRRVNDGSRPRPEADRRAAKKNGGHTSAGRCGGALRGTENDGGPMGRRR